ncbi:glycosyl transferase family 2 [Paludibacter propionicigenes WB4]|uniref:Glycosyl transferase family 2 n=1 Tax=Paludibacter propionicigenes (strain DSM 17365 / JCM 13257 / WB4) TaxID=694427 RepID=E4T5U1_PALPW|nr:glycosyltransferase family 2 protein [Paludibacter propionicigenes]ADQ80085.1 glycosyl transferase family 2 [Paludibacter propionicigenes WB4]
MFELIKVARKDCSKSKFSILIPSWNNLDYLQVCINSILKNSVFDHQIIVVVNDGNDGTLEWVKNNQILDYVHAKENIGICYALNICRGLIKTDYVLYANDDMYFLPNWDKILADEIEKIGHKNFMLSATMIEPTGENPCSVIRNYGNDIKSFREADLLADQEKLYRDDWNGSTWPPNIVHIDNWDLVGGMSIEYSPGMYSDPDLSRKLWEAGIRIFKGKGTSLVYHFACKSTGRIRKNKGQKTFVLKWNISAKTFQTKYLLRGQSVVNELPEIHLTTTEKLKQLIKRLKAVF